MSGPTCSSTMSHIHGSVCIPSFSSGFGSKLAWIADHDREIVFIGRDDADGRRAARLALSVGVRNVAGLLAGGMTNWRQERHPATETERLPAAELPERLEQRERPAAARRQRAQRVERRPCARVRCSLPGTTSADIPEGLDPELPIAVICAAGVRAATAASLLKLYGARHVIHVTDGGVPRLAEEGVMLETGAAAN